MLDIAIGVLVTVQLDHPVHQTLSVFDLALEKEVLDLELEQRRRPDDAMDSQFVDLEFLHDAAFSAISNGKVYTVMPAKIKVTTRKR